LNNKRRLPRAQTLVLSFDGQIEWFQGSSVFLMCSKLVAPPVRTLGCNTTVRFIFIRKCDVRMVVWVVDVLRGLRGVAVGELAWDACVEQPPPHRCVRGTESYSVRLRYRRWDKGTWLHRRKQQSTNRRHIQPYLLY
jgi:hypothetical protein